MIRRTSFLIILLATAGIGRGDPRTDHWAWKAPARPMIPIVRGVQIANPIDAYIRLGLEKAGLVAARPASREQLIRRVTFDLIGLPPTPGEIDSFLHDPAPNAWEKVIDRLLASPHYGERWARHWLDLVRYADTNGFEFDEPRPNAWRYRDYVIRSLNADKPYDRFIVEQLAGDEAYPGDRDALIATGFNLLGPDMTDSSDQMQRRQNTLNDITDTTGLVFLGMTITCARCHDHKFEPIPQTDYYRLQAFFTPADFRRDLPIASAEERMRSTKPPSQLRVLTQSDSGRDRRDWSVRFARRLFEAKLARLSEEARAAHRTPADQRTGGQQELVRETERLGRRLRVPRSPKRCRPTNVRRLAALKDALEVIRQQEAACAADRDGLDRSPWPAAEDACAGTRRDSRTQPMK